MEQYAERLRALHRDLTLVLQAVERGLATAASTENVVPPVPAHEPIEIVPEPAEEPAVSAAPPVARRNRMPRVEVMPAPSGEQRRYEEEDRREPPAPYEPAPRWAKEERAGVETDVQGEPELETAPRGRDTPRPAPRFPPRPSVAAEGIAREPEWVERGDGGFTAPTFPPAGPQRLTISPLVAAGFIFAWLVVVALLVALLVS